MKRNKDIVIREISNFFDTQWFLEHYRRINPQLSEETVLDYYLDNVKDMLLNPNEHFDEESYLLAYKDIKIEVEHGNSWCGFEHYIRHGLKEGRQAVRLVEAEKKRVHQNSEKLEVIIPNVTKPVLLEKFHSFYSLYNFKIKHSFTSQAPKNLNVVIPHLEIDILFGGYTAFLEFLNSLSGHNVPLRFLVTEPIGGQNPLSILWRFQSAGKDVAKLIQCNTVHFLATGDEVTLGENDRYLAYSSKSARIAKKLADESNGKKIFFFIQEYEPIFHAHNSFGWYDSEPFYYDYIAIFNSLHLKEYFLKNSIHIDPDAFFFQHAISASPRSLAEFHPNALTRKLFVYARPEHHAERNMFEFAMKIIDECFRQGVLNTNWSIVAVGSLATCGEFMLPCGVPIDVQPRMGKAEYYNYIKGFDVGLSLIYAPHPGVVHYELAASGVVTVTNQYFNRCRDSNYREGNLIFSKPTLEHFVSAMREAVALSENVQERFDNQQLQSASSWAEAFSSVSSDIARIFHDQKKDIGMLSLAEVSEN